MTEKNSSFLTFFENILNAPSPSGFEQPAAHVWREATRPYADEIKTDVMGNSYGIINSGSPVSIMLAGHTDEIGFIVRHVSEQGYIYFGPIGGHDANVVVGQRVLVHTVEHGSIPGVIGKKPIHLLDARDREKAVVLTDMFVDIGATGRAEVEEKVSVGDPITYSAPFQLLENGLYAAHAVDDKGGAIVVSETLRLLSATRDQLKANVYGVCTVQEEVGLRGARTSSYVTGATVGVAIDVGHASDYPGVEKNKVGESKLGGGPVITRGANINPQVFNLLIEAAKEEGIPYQVDAQGGGTGTDANAMQLNQGGMATGLISIPLRYMHTPCEVGALSDIENAAKLLAAFIRKVTPEVDFTPSLSNLKPPRYSQPKPKDASGESKLEDS